MPRIETYLAWLQRRIPWHIKVLAIREGTIDEDQEFHREHRECRADHGGNEWYGLEMLPAAREFLTSQPFTEGHAYAQVGGSGLKQRSHRVQAMGVPIK